MSTMQKVLLGGALAALLLCSGAGLFAYYRLWPLLKEGSSEAVETEVAYNVQLSMENALVMHKNDPCAVQLAGHDLNISTFTDTSGDRQVNIVNGDATILNGDVDITAGGLDIFMADMQLHAVPMIEEGTFVLTETDVDRSLAAFLIDESALETGFENGVNAGLQRANLIPVSVRIEDGTMTIGCEAQSEP